MNANHRRRGRWWLLIAFCVLVAIALALAPTVLTKVCWVGSKELRVSVVIADADTMKPLSGVPITVFNGPMSPVEALTPAGVPVPRPDPASGDVQHSSTDKNGRVEFSRRFNAAGSDQVFRHSGWVELRGTWVQIEPPGSARIVLPIDGQSIRPRDIDDNTPVFITILVSGQTNARVLTRQ